MAKERFNKEVKTHLNMVAIYDKFADDWEKKHNLKLTYSEVSKKIAERIVIAGNVKV